MKIVIERHDYAPELNKAWLVPDLRRWAEHQRQDSRRINVPGCTTTKEVREEYFAPLKRKGHFVTVTATYPEQHKNLNRIYRGMVHNLAQVREVLNERRRYHNVPGAVVTAKLELVG